MSFVIEVKILGTAQSCMVGSCLLPVCVTSFLPSPTPPEAFSFPVSTGWYYFLDLLTYPSFPLMLQIHVVVTSSLVLREGESEQRLKTRPGPWTQHSLSGKVTLDLPSLWKLPCYDQCGRTLELVYYKTPELWDYTYTERNVTVTEAWRNKDTIKTSWKLRLLLLCF